MTKIKSCTSYLRNIKEVHEVVAIIHSWLIENLAEDIFIVFDMEDEPGEHGDQMHAITFKWTYGTYPYEFTHVFDSKSFPGRYPVERCFAQVSQQMIGMVNAAIDARKEQECAHESKP